MLGWSIWSLLVVHCSLALIFSTTDAQPTIANASPLAGNECISSNAPPRLISNLPNISLWKSRARLCRCWIQFRLVMKQSQQQRLAEETTSVVISTVQAETGVQRHDWPASPAVQVFQQVLAPTLQVLLSLIRNVCPPSYQMEWRLAEVNHEYSAFWIWM